MKEAHALCWHLNILPLNTILAIDLWQTLGHGFASLGHVVPVLDHVDKRENGMAPDILWPAKLGHGVINTGIAQVALCLHRVTCRIAARCRTIACSHVDWVAYLP